MVYFFIRVLVGNIPVVQIDDISTLLEASGDILPEYTVCLQGLIHGNGQPAIDLCLSVSLMDIFLVVFGCQLSQKFYHSTI